MSALNTDLLRKAAPLFATQLSGSISPSDTTIPLQSVANLPIDTAVTLTIDATDANNNLTPNFKETVTGVVNTGSSSLINCVRGLDGTTAQAHSTGASVVQWFTADDWNDFISSYLTEHVQLGHHKSLGDVNGHSWLGQSAASNAVNYLTLGNAATTASPSIVATGTDTNIPITLTPKGNGKIITPNGTLSSYALTNPSKFFAYLNTGYDLVSGTSQRVTFDTVLFDTNSDYSLVNNRFVAPINGFYELHALVTVQVLGNNAFNIMLYKNGTPYIQGDLMVPTYAEFAQTWEVSVNNTPLNASDYIEVFFFNNQPGTHNVFAGSTPYATYFEGGLKSQT